jgi:NitT/TauT family transport system substrate-binding protein
MIRPLLALTLLFAIPARAQTHVTIALAIPPTATDGLTAAAEELGLFREVGIEPEFIVFQGAGAFLPQIAQKKVLIGLPLIEPVLASYDTGKAKLPVTFFYNANPYNGLELAVLASSPYHTIADMRGQSIGVGALTWGTIPQTRAMLRDAGLTPGSNVDIVPVGVLGSGFQALRTGRVAALNYNESWTRLMEQQGTPLRRLPMKPIFVSAISNAYVAHRDTIRDQPDLLARFGRVVTEITAVCAAVPEYCVKAFWRAHPETRPKPEDEATTLAAALDTMQRRSQRMATDDAGRPRVPGQFDLPAIRTYVQALHKTGELATDDIPVDQLFTNVLVPEFTRFDRDAVIARARARP